jgi:hypothetical protein
MSTYPGDDPKTPDDPQNPAAQPPPEDDVPTPEDADGTEPTQPVGYWERRAREQAAERGRVQGGQPYPTTPYTQGGPVFNPTSAYPTQQPAPGFGPAPQGPSPYGQHPYGQNPQGPYGGPGAWPYGAQPPGQPPAPGQPAPYMPMPPHVGFVAPARDHPQATLSLVLGLVGLVGFFICGVTLVMSPFAWAFGHSALREIRASQGRIGGESQAQTGMILGIIGTVILILAVIVLIGIILLAVLSESSTTGSSV